eukprot:NODE_342_length_9153_cov_0.637376.p1 type:complete len:480 gc:universal NODE_342_length_9153_cov_0.637376:2147-708(-)
MTLISIILVYFSLLTRLYGISSDCPLIISFLKGLNLHLTDPLVYKQIPADCCSTNINYGKAELYIRCAGVSTQYVTYLVLSNVNINGEIKSQFIPLNLHTLVIHATPLSTTIPNDLPNAIRYLALYDNLLYGAIPENLPSQLIDLELNQNQLGVMPKSFPSSLTNLILYGNLLTTMPRILPPNLQYIDVSNNLIFDELPNEFPNTLTYLGASNNMIYGPIEYIPPNLNQILMKNNQLNGSLPYFPDSLRSLELQFNQLTGHLQSRLPNEMYKLSLAYNILTGSISNFASVANLNNLDLSWNLFTGILPVLGSAIYTTVDFSHNLLMGDIDLSNSKVDYLYLSFNQFKKLPVSLPQSISHFGLAGNSLSGNISNNLFSTLYWLDLSCNLLTGNIPSISPYYYLNISHNLFTGSIPISLKSVGVLDLSYNQLSGCINFQFTGSSFYFNNNFLSGNFSFKTPYEMYIQNNLITDVSIDDTSN